MFNLFLIVFILNFFFFIFHKKVSKIYNLFDYPDYTRKIHKRRMPLLGGLFLISNLFYILIYKNFYNSYEHLIFFKDLKKYNFFFLITFLFYLIGFYDDKYKISFNLKFILYIPLILLTLFFNENILIKKLEFSFLKDSIDLGIFSYIFTIFCFLLFINAFNMLDGINGQATCYILFIFLLLISKSVLVPFVAIISIGLLHFLILNFYNRSFLGDNGTLPIGYMISYIFIELYNSTQIFLPEEIFLIMAIPGYELLRLAIQRIYKKKNPFLPDNNHIHHLIMKKNKFIISFLMVQILLIIPYSTYILFNSFLLSFIISLFFYVFSIIFFYKKA